MRLMISLILAAMLASCNNDPKLPSVSDIKIELQTRRFEKELFNLDTTRPGPQLDQLIARYPSFGESFISTILSSDPAWSADSVNAYLKGFVSSYRPVYDTAEIIFKDFTVYENEIRKSLQFLRYYFPQYKAPHNIITYIGPLDGFGDILTEDALLIGLHHHLGSNYSGYRATWLQETYPAYISYRFEPSYIVVNCMKNIVNDMFPEKTEDKTLVIQMVEKGKRLFMLEQLIPGKESYKLIGYTEPQLKDCYAHEAQIWNLFLQNSLLQSNNNSMIKNYVNEGPKTQELGDASPGNIGSFVGWQIVKKFVEINPKMSLSQLMATDAEIIFAKAKYKP